MSTAVDIVIKNEDKNENDSVENVDNISEVKNIIPTVKIEKDEANANLEIESSSQSQSTSTLPASSLSVPVPVSVPVLTGVSLYVQPVTVIKSEDMPVAASRIVNPFSR